MSQGS